METIHVLIYYLLFPGDCNITGIQYDLHSSDLLLFVFIFSSTSITSFWGDRTSKLLSLLAIYSPLELILYELVLPLHISDIPSQASLADGAWKGCSSLFFPLGHRTLRQDAVVKIDSGQSYYYFHLCNYYFFYFIRIVFLR